ncbi:hypothetical protein AVEN_153332-1 [Araneus ventricosus]|uniref:Uncharacterized protein n=1 Tax=Araneus ventricosus TaxID=182803 RepID=A0A4Y2M735_ARAVE|nr:hypothetical protein AVEN_153332-1 [Araneus ventricosus]
MYTRFSSQSYRGCGGLSNRSPSKTGLKPDSLKIIVWRLCISHTRRPKSSGVLSGKEEYRSVTSHHLTAVQNYDVRPKIALVLLQNGR